MAISDKLKAKFKQSAQGGANPVKPVKKRRPRTTKSHLNGSVSLMAQAEESQEDPQAEESPSPEEDPKKN